MTKHLAKGVPRRACVWRKWVESSANCSEHEVANKIRISHGDHCTGRGDGCGVIGV